MALSDYQQLVDDLVRDTTGVTDAAGRDTAISFAASRYSLDRPRKQVESVVGDGSEILPFPASWDAVSSKVTTIAIGGDTPLGAIHRDTPTGPELRADYSVGLGVAVWIWFTTPHTLDAVEDTIPVEDREAVASYAAGMLFDQLAANAAGDMMPAIDADTIDHQGKNRDYASLAKQARKRYFDHLGIDPTRLKPASASVDLDFSSSQGHDRLFHGRRLR